MLNLFLLFWISEIPLGVLGNRNSYLRLLGGRVRMSGKNEDECCPTSQITGTIVSVAVYFNDANADVHS